MRAAAFLLLVTDSGGIIVSFGNDCGYALSHNFSGVKQDGYSVRFKKNVTMLIFCTM